jgi:hypothetical protein
MLTAECTDIVDIPEDEDVSGSWIRPNELCEVVCVGGWNWGC